ncbi:MAG: hypothetical protein WC975_11165 [Phycisphaerae bacterium]
MTYLLKCAKYLTLAALIGGCQSANRASGPVDKPPIFYEDINWVSLMVQLPLVDEDGDKQPDGISVRVMLLRPNEPKFVAGKGTMIFHLMRREKLPDGTLDDKEIYKWTLVPDDFVKSVVRQGFGIVCHQMVLYWKNLHPHGTGIYLRAEFIRTDQKVLQSRIVPISVSVAD